MFDCEMYVRGDEGAVPNILVQPIGLITNEFVTNAAKHAAGRIEILYTIKDGLHELMDCEEGPGLPPDFDPAMQKQSLGMRVLTYLQKRQNGTIASSEESRVRTECGSTCRARWSPEHKKR